ncbi:MAG: Trm112 family protein [Mariprofundaceae bacterium]|nr:Trm112 family protein [Mariprofundaceae bacterium]
MIDAKLLDILVCPQCKGKVAAHADNSALVCPACELAYPIRDDIPVMLVDEASSLKAGADAAA